MLTRGWYINGFEYKCNIISFLSSFVFFEDSKVNDGTQDTCDESDNPFDDDDCPLLKMKPTQEVEEQVIGINNIVFILSM